jgi:hypothetical protein
MPKKGYTVWSQFADERGRPLATYASQEMALEAAKQLDRLFSDRKHWIVPAAASETEEVLSQPRPQEMLPPPPPAQEGQP